MTNCQPPIELAQSINTKIPRPLAPHYTACMEGNLYIPALIICPMSVARYPNAKAEAPR